MFRNLLYLFVLACLVSACNTTQQHIADADIIYNRAEQSIEGSDEEIADIDASVASIKVTAKKA